ncbi:MAG: sigma-70 family RNA polymerase sigma factor [Bacteroidota bacterium]
MNNLAADQQLVKKCLSKNSKAQSQLYNKYRIRMYGICMRYASCEAEAQDFLQEGFIKVFNNLHQYRGEGALGKWIERVIVNRIISILRKKKMVLDDSVSLDQISVAVEEPIKSSQSKADQLIQLVQQLPSGYRAVFNLYALEGYSHSEISTILNISESTSRSQYYRAKTTIQNLLKQSKSQ